MSIGESIFAAAFMMALVFMGLIALYFCVRLCSLVFMRLEQSHKKDSQ